MTGDAVVIRGDAAHLPLADGSVDLIVTSPPYFALRAYKDGDESYDGQIGSEPTPQDFLEALWTCTEEWKRVLAPTGSMFVNLGDKYAGSGGHNNAELTRAQRGGGKYPAEMVEGFIRDAPTGYNKNSSVKNVRTGELAEIAQKSLMGLPWRYALGCTDDLGLLLRAEIIWEKPNGLPESVTDRVRRNHEQWFHLTKRGRYYAAIDELREPHKGVDNAKSARGPSGMNRGINTGEGDEPVGNFARDPLGKLPPSVLEVATEPLSIDQATIDHFNLPKHFAAFPTAWPYFFIKGWSPPAICLECGEGRVPVVEKSYEVDHVQSQSRGRQTIRADGTYDTNDRGINAREGRVISSTRATILGYACRCCPHTDHEGTGESSGPTYADALEAGDYASNEFGGKLANRPRVGGWREWHLDDWTPPPSRLAVVLDPFGGTGTTAMVARALGRFGISNDMSADYCRLAEWRIFRSGHWRKARDKEMERTVATFDF